MAGEAGAGRQPVSRLDADRRTVFRQRVSLAVALVSGGPSASGGLTRLRPIGHGPVDRRRRIVTPHRLDRAVGRIATVVTGRLEPTAVRRRDGSVVGTALVVPIPQTSRAAGPVVVPGWLVTGPTPGPGMPVPVLGIHDATIPRVLGRPGRRSAIAPQGPTVPGARQTRRVGTKVGRSPGRRRRAGRGRLIVPGPQVVLLMVAVTVAREVTRGVARTAIVVRPLAPARIGSRVDEMSARSVLTAEALIGTVRSRTVNARPLVRTVPPLTGTGRALMGTVRRRPGAPTDSCGPVRVRTAEPRHLVSNGLTDGRRRPGGPQSRPWPTT